MKFQSTLEKRLFQSLVVVSVLLFTALFIQTCEPEPKLSQNELYNSLQDSLSFYKNKNGELVGTISTIQTSKIKDFLDIQSKDKEITRLQSLVKTYKNRMGAGSVAGIITTKGLAETRVATIVDTSKVYPVYFSEFNLDNWVWGSIRASRDSTDIQVQYAEDISFVLLRERKSIFHKYRYTSEITVHNPYSSVQSYRTYQVKDKTRPKIVIGPNVGFNLTSEFKIVPTIGVGATFPLIIF
jgi:hypothetical protein